MFTDCVAFCHLWLLIACKYDEAMMHAALEKQFLNDVNQHIRIVYRIGNVYYADNKEEREDLFQEIMYQLWKAYPSFNGKSKFSTWLYQVALNTAITHRKKNNRIPAKEKLASTYNQIAESNEQLHQEEKTQVLYAAIHTLTDVDKAIILLYLEENSYEEIATITGLTRTNVSVRLVRIKRALEEKLKRTVNLIY